LTLLSYSPYSLTRKCHCLAVGKLSKVNISHMLLGGNKIEWFEHVRYLGVYLMRSKSVKFYISPIKRPVYVACNSIFSHSHGVNEMTLLALQESYSLSVLLYASPALLLTCKQISELNVRWNGVIRRIFGYHEWESVIALICELRRSNVAYELLVCKAKFYKRLYCKSGFLNDIFWMFLLSGMDECVIDIFRPLPVVINDVFKSFFDSVYD